VRQRDGRGQVAGQHAAARGGKRQALLSAERGDALGDQRLGRLDGEQGTAEGEAVVGELRHGRRSRGLPPGM